MKQATIALTMVLLFGTGCVAATECAWVLWQENWQGSTAELTPIMLFAPGSSSWRVKDAFSGRQGCIAARRDLMASNRKAGLDEDFAKLGEVLSVDETSMTIAIPEEGGTSRLIINSYKCLPDTIDPREKKE